MSLGPGRLQRRILVRLASARGPATARELCEDLELLPRSVVIFVRADGSLAKPEEHYAGAVDFRTYHGDSGNVSAALSSLRKRKLIMFREHIVSRRDPARRRWETRWQITEAGREWLTHRLEQTYDLVVLAKKGGTWLRQAST